MFVRLSERVERMARRRVKARVAELADALRRNSPTGIAVEIESDGVRLSGRGLARRFLLDPARRWLALRWADERRRKK